MKRMEAIMGGEIKAFRAGACKLCIFILLYVLSAGSMLSVMLGVRDTQVSSIVTHVTYSQLGEAEI